MHAGNISALVKNDLSKITKQEPGCPNILPLCCINMQTPRNGDHKCRKYVSYTCRKHASGTLKVNPMHVWEKVTPEIAKTPL